MAAGAILPPPFFERRRLESKLRSENGIFRNTRKRNRGGRRIHLSNSTANVNQPGRP